MAAVFPGAVRLFTAKTDLVDTVLADHVNLLQDEVTSIESTLGTGMLASSWSGVYTTPATHTSVANRLTNIEAGLTYLNTNKADASGVVTTTGVATLTNKTMSGASNTFSAIPQSAVTSLTSDLAAKAPLASPALTGSPTAPTQAASDNSTKIATTAYADGAVSTHNAVTAAHGATGAVVGTTNTQTLSNKTLSSPTINNPTIAGTATVTAAMTASGGGQFAGLGAVQICTSATRPGSPGTGQHIYETDTDKTLKWSGSAWNQVSGSSTGAEISVFFLGGM